MPPPAPYAQQPQPAFAPAPQPSPYLGAPGAPPPGADRASGPRANPILADGFVLYPKLGFLLTGSGDYKYDDSYSGSTTDKPSPSSKSVDDKSGFAIGADFLGSVTPNLRLGGGLLWVPSLKAKIGDTERTAGNQFNVAGIVEPVFPISPTVALALRGQGGISFLIPGSDLGDEIDNKKKSCSEDTAAGDPKCDVSGSLGLGWNAGGGGGAIVDVGSGVRLRLDLLMQYMSQGLWSYSHTHRVSGDSGTYTHDVSYSISGTRFWIFAGFEA